jgi:arabinose-5-phosphate isomerase
MHGGDDLPRVAPGTLLKDALLEMSRKRLGMITICAEDNSLLGIYTDGDLRRTLEKAADVYRLKIDEVMSANPRTIHQDKLAAEAGFVMKEKQITSLAVVDNAGKLAGVLHMHDLLRAGVF